MSEAPKKITSNLMVFLFRFHTQVGTTHRNGPEPLKPHLKKNKNKRDLLAKLGNETCQNKNRARTPLHGEHISSPEKRERKRENEGEREREREKHTKIKDEQTGVK